MAQNDTAERLLYAATQFFAERGFAETSLHTITCMVGANLAAVNYHFGSKRGLMQAVFPRALSPYCRELELKLDVLEKQAGERALEAEVLLRSMLVSLLFATEVIRENTQIFTRLLSLAYTQSREYLRHYLITAFGLTYNRMVSLMRKICSDLNPVELYWRLYSMLGASVFSLAGIDSVRSILNAEYYEDTEAQPAINMIIPPIATMLTSPNVK